MYTFYLEDFDLLRISENIDHKRVGHSVGFWHIDPKTIKIVFFLFNTSKKTTDSLKK